MKTVLIVDPSEHTRQRIKSFLPSSYKAIEASNERTALTLLSSNPDVILLATDTPDSGGFELFNHVNINNLQDSTKLIFLKPENLKTTAFTQKLTKNQTTLNKNCSKEEFLNLLSQSEFAVQTQVAVMEPNLAYQNLIDYTLGTINIPVTPVTDPAHLTTKDTTLLIDHSLLDNDVILKLETLKSNQTISKIILMIEFNTTLNSPQIINLCDDIIEKPFKEKELQLKVSNVAKKEDDKESLLYISKDIESGHNFLSHLTSKYDIQYADSIPSSLNGQPDIKLLLIDMETIKANELSTLEQLQKTNDIPALLILSDKCLTTNLLTQIQSRDFIFKPFTPNLLDIKIKKYLTKKQEKTTLPDFAATPQPHHIIKNESTRFKPNPSFKHSEEVNQLIVSINHQLRSPLTTILAGSQSLNLIIKDEKQKKIFSEIESSAKKIRKILDDLETSKEYMVEKYLNNIRMLKINQTDESDPKP